MDILTRSHRLWVFAAAAAALVLAAPGVRAQIFSPGKLAAPHATWDSLQSCDRCHTGKSAVEKSLCLDCHKPLAEQVRKNAGYHGRPGVREKRCEGCHTDHKGRDTKMVRWQGGKKEAFPHAEAGWALSGGHAKVACDKCHGLTRIFSPAVSAYVSQHKAPHTYLGLPTACAPCHFDEHRGSLPKTCETCHDEKSFKQVPKFSHDKSWPLKGGHKKPKCEKCHKQQKDPAYNAATIPKPRAETYLQMKPLPKERCTDCHKDVHNNRYGADCVSCHTIDDWKVRELVLEKLKFHDKTGYPLKERHRFVTCGRCHPERQGKPHYKPVAHDACTRCHANAHPDAKGTELAKWACNRCHNEAAWAPAAYGAKEHETTRFPLRDAHQAAPCPSCHIKDMGEPFREAAGQRTADGFLSVGAVSPWRMHSDKAMPRNCEQCHPTPHRAQFPGRPCTECHNANRWLVDTTRFDHDKSGGAPGVGPYKLEGRHKKVACVLCHAQGEDKTGRFVRYKPLKRECASCHPDPHYGQFERLEPRLDCKDCHTIDEFKIKNFAHNDPRLSDYPLKGKHAPLKCEQCHPKTTLSAPAATVRYRPLPAECEACHEDFHKGSYASAAAPAASRRGAPPPDTARTSTPPQGAPKPPTPCAACHVEASWKKVSYNHQKSGFPIRGRHKKVACAACHKPAQNPPRDCAGCHNDVHRGRLGTDCAECHGEDNFRRTQKFAARHNRTTFPLAGRHAMTPCRECHRDVRDLGFQNTPSECSACHAARAPAGARALLDHASLSARCDSCHTPVTWKGATFRDHERCFRINAGNHAGIACGSCHTGTISKSSTCNANGFSCAGCHRCNGGEHPGVRGFDCKDRKCYQCHPGG